MADLLIEILTEEVPFGEHKNQVKALEGFLKENNLFGENGNVFSTPHRLVASCKGIPSEVEIPAKKHKGPSVNSASNAIEGFFKRLNISKEDAIIENDCYFYNENKKTVKTEETLRSLTTPLMERIALSFSKTMVWNETKKSWIRPIHNLLFIFDGKVIKFEYAGIKSSNSTKINSKDYTIKNEDNLASLLRQNNIILNQAERMDSIIQSLKSIEQKHNITCIAPSRLLEENTYIAEFPKIGLTQFSEKYLTLPSKVLVESLQKNQKYFLFNNQKGELSNFFAVCINGNFSKEVESNILKGNETVLNARLEDAFYYIKVDGKKTLKEHAEALKNIVFHKNAGSIYERINRMLAILESFKANLEPSIFEDLKTAVSICKADLGTEMIQSFPELQGYICAFYAKKEGIKEEVANAIESHYLLGGQTIENNANKLSLFLALIEKYEKVETLLNAGEMPTSSRDPFAIRKEILSIIRIIIEGKLEVPLNIKGMFKDILFDRLEVYLSDPDLKTLLLQKEKGQAIINLLEIYKKAEDIKLFKPQLLLYKRIYNILNSKEAQKYKGNKIDSSILNKDEKLFINSFNNVTSLKEFAEKAESLESFFANNLIIDELNENISKNRVAILEMVAEKLSGIISL